MYKTPTKRFENAFKNVDMKSTTIGKSKEKKRFLKPLEMTGFDNITI